MNSKVYTMLTIVSSRPLVYLWMYEYNLSSLQSSFTCDVLWGVDDASHSIGLTSCQTVNALVSLHFIRTTIGRHVDVSSFKHTSSVIDFRWTAGLRNVSHCIFKIIGLRMDVWEFIQAVSNLQLRVMHCDLYTLLAILSERPLVYSLMLSFHLRIVVVTNRSLVLLGVNDVRDFIWTAPVCFLM